MAQIIELRATDASATNDLNVGEHRAVHREDALHANAVRDLSHGERLAHTTSTPRNADALESLNALLLTFLYAHIDAQRVACTEGRNSAKPLFFGFDEWMHMTLGARNAPRLAAAPNGRKSILG